MASTILNSTIILNEALALLHNSLGFTKTVNRQYDSKFAKGGVSGKPGTSLSVRKPMQYTIRSGRTLDIQDTIAESVTINCATQKGIDFTFTSEDLTMKIDQFSDLYLKPAMARLASQIDQDGLALYSQLGQSVGTPGTSPNAASMYLSGAQKLDEKCAPRDGKRYACINPAAEAATVAALTTLFAPSQKIGDQYNTGEMGQGLGLNFVRDNLVNAHTCGSRTGSILIDDAAGANNTQGSTTIHVDALGGATQTLTAGDVFTVADVYDVNPETKAKLGSLKQFVVKALATAGSNEVDIVVDAMYTTGPRQNIDAFPADGKAVTVVGTASTAYPQNLIYHRDAFTLVTADLILPGGCDMAERAVMDGISMRMVRNYDINNDQLPIRFDVYYGWTCLRPEWAVRLWG